jgi:hypothetical protein
VVLTHQAIVTVTVTPLVTAAATEAYSSSSSMRCHISSKHYCSSLLQSGLLRAV